MIKQEDNAFCLTWWQRGPCWIFTFLISAGIIVAFFLYNHLSSSYTIPKNINRKKLRYFCFSKELNYSRWTCMELPPMERAGIWSDWKINCSPAENRTDPSNSHFLATAPTAICKDVRKNPPLSWLPGLVWRTQHTARKNCHSLSGPRRWKLSWAKLKHAPGTTPRNPGKLNTSSIWHPLQIPWLHSTASAGFLSWPSFHSAPKQTCCKGQPPAPL